MTERKKTNTNSSKAIPAVKDELIQLEFEIRTASLSRRFQFNQSIRGVASIGAAGAAAATWFNQRPLDGAEVDIPMN